MRFKCRVLFVVLLLCISVSAQKNHKQFKIESCTKIDELKYSMGKDFGGRYSDLMSCFWNDTLYFFMIDYDCYEMLRLYKYDIKTSTYSYCDIDIKPICSLFRGSPYMIEHFATNGTDLVLYDVNSEACLWFFKKQGDTFVFDSKLPDSDNLFSKDMQFLPNGKLLGLKNYPFSGDDNPTKLSLLNMNGKMLEKIVEVDFPLIGFTFLSPYKNLSINSKSIMLSQRGEYRISEYDFDLNKKGDLTAIPENWNQMTMALSYSIMNSSLPLANKCHAFSSAIDEYSYIQSVYSDENSMLVSYKLRGEESFFYFDVWSKEEGLWTLKDRNINDKTNSIRHCFERSLLGVGANDVELFVIEDRILRLRLDMPDMGWHIKPIYMHKLEEYLMNNELSFVVEVLQFD